MYRVLFERYPVPLWVYDPVTLRFLAVNDAAIDAYGYSREDFLAMTIEDIRPVDEVPVLNERLRASDVGRGLVKAGVWTHRRSDGSPIEVEVVSHTIEFGGVDARLVLARDITEQQVVQEQLRQAQRLDAIGSLAGGIAHDFNNLMMVVQLVAGELAKELTDPQQLHHLRLIEGAIARGTRLTKQLLAFGSRQVMHPERTDVNEVLQETLELLERVIGEDILLVRELAPDIAPILIDPSQLDQVLLNLAVNAREAMPDGGTLTVRTSTLELGAAYVDEHLDVAPGRYVLLQITDTGSGMDHATRTRAFEPFFTTKAHGSGFGLATVYGIVKQNRGHVWLYSEPGLGTTFRLYFPETSEDAPEPTVQPKSAALEGSETILFVDDEELLRPLIGRALATHGYTVLTAADADEALDLAAGHPGPIDLLITDVVLPGMNGCDLAKRLQERRPELRILYTSGYPGDTVLAHGVAQCDVAYLEKPYALDELVRVAREEIGRPGPHQT
jgi:PAS domain S-box-containing protein